MKTSKMTALLPQQQLLGVIDIGSNSVRMVLYDASIRGPVPIFNEKSFCGLVVGIEKTGRLNPEGIQETHQAMSRFTSIFKELGVSEYRIVATAAVRDAEDGEEFIDELRNRYNSRIEILSGMEEAELAAFGVTSSIRAVDGVVGDLGGGSLEVVAVKNQKIQKTEEQCMSLPFGLLRYRTLAFKNITKAEKIIDELLATFPLESLLRGKTFYTVGGGFRTIAKMHLAKTNYPLSVLHNYSVDADDLLTMVDGITCMTKKTLEAYPGVVRKRLDTIPLSALVLQRIITIGKPSEVVFSSYGIREGCLHTLLPEEVREKDPLIASCAAVMPHQSEWEEYGNILTEWLLPIIKDIFIEKHLVQAVCSLSIFPSYELPEYRAGMAFRRILDAPLISINHKERIWIALALFYCFESSLNEERKNIVTSFLDRESILKAKKLGTAIRLARNISGFSPDILQRVGCSLDLQELSLTFREEDKKFMNKHIQKRLDKLASLFGVEAVVN